ncbi:sensor histidine kinase [Algicella marina]|uniref:GAF domain-containing protein n=1 Tax=Algicella marina TaxID=2683284 RepID=A0A6P1SSV4_9RHOB|nr:histidine kinase dimerization/phosphoacceptor domain -containing protein [Algicella marina]QHQ33754.1 GAF domain-containing protein [Algicella marina]
MKAKQHADHRERLSALYSYEVLDTDPEDEFDDIVKLAAAHCGVPIALISFVEEERQWFKAETGLGICETPIENSICAHALLEDDFLEIEDTLADERTVANSLCTPENGLRFYAGCLLRSADGLPLGTLCVLDYKPRRLTPLQRDTMRVLARQVMSQLEMRKALTAADILRKEVDHRVKNSLQSLSSFARLQSRAYKSREAKTALSTVLARIDAMTRLHEQLYMNDDHMHVDLGSYIRTICDQLADMAPRGVTLEIATESASVNSQQAAAVGTFLNEFVTNSFKHGFPGQRPGRVKVHLARQPEGTLRLVCSDNGVGMSEGATDNKAGLGMKIAEIISLELDCEHDLRSSDDGVVSTLVFRPSRLDNAAANAARPNGHTTNLEIKIEPTAAIRKLAASEAVGEAR